MSTYKLLFLDIDGTIIKPDDTIEDSTKQAVAMLKNQGIEVFLATGRPIHEIQGLAKELSIDSIIGYNGALGIYQGKEIFKIPMDVETVEQIIDIAWNHHHELIMHTSSKNLVTTIDSPLIEKIFKKFHYTKNELFQAAENDLADVISIAVLSVLEDEVELYNSVPGVHFAAIHVEGIDNCYDVIREKVNKGTGIQLMLNHLGIVKEEAIAFGDGMNDKEMLMSVGESFAMGNSHPDLFQYAKHQTTAVTESGVYNGLKQLGLLK